MRYKTVSIILITLLITSGFIVSGIKIKNYDEKPKTTFLSVDENDADLPIWNVGDSWVYYCDVAGGYKNDINFDISVDNMEIEVVEVLAESYKLSVSVPKGDVTGSGRALGISGSLINTRINGFIFINKSNLAIINSDISIDGYIDKIIDIHFTVDMSTNFSNSNFNNTNFSALRFPMNVSEYWVNPLVYVISELNLNLLPQPSMMYLMIQEQLFTCSEWDTVDVSGTEYDALKISRGVDNDYIWYSPRAGAVVKIDYSNIDIGFGYFFDDLTMNLKSTTYSIQTNPPNTPSTPSGPTLLDVGSLGDYISSTTDPDNDKIRYIFDWGDGTKTTSDFYSSGDTATITKTWNKKGNFSVKVKARDKYGGESDWSGTIQVEILNDAPLKPGTPQGPASGKIRKSYDYSTSTTDLDGHNIRYGWDWDGDKKVDEWTSYKNSGATVTTSHTWYSQGNYNIYVIAEDEYGEQSEWSDPLPVSIPKTKILVFNFSNLIDYFKVRFPIFAKIQFLNNFIFLLY
jgi:hypothetical protein